jgi:3-methyladenine DNA glycosylase AlkD
MTSTELIKTIEEFCMLNTSEENILKYNRYFKENVDMYGLTAPQIHGKVSELKKNKGLTFDIVLEAAGVLIERPKSEEVTFALLLVNGFGKQFTKPVFREIERWYSISITNWAHADTLGMLILPDFFKYNIININDFDSWLTSNYKFQRRSVPVALIKYLKMNKTINFTSVFEYVEPLLLDKDREVHQGTGWFLREAWKIKNKETEMFLMKWKNEVPRLIIQYATEKMSKEEKMNYKRVSQL